jgi:hypothetical protein
MRYNKDNFLLIFLFNSLLKEFFDYIYKEEDFNFF